MMSNEAKLLTKFRISYQDLSGESSVSEAFANYSDKCSKFSDARTALSQAISEFRGALDGLLRSQGLVPDGRDWTFKENDDGDLLVFVWSETRRSGRRKSEAPFQSLASKKRIRPVKAALPTEAHC